MSNHVLKQLQTRKAKLEAELNRLEAERKDADKACNEVRGKIRSVCQQIAEATKEPCVTEHAVIRYLERVHGMDIEGIKSTILNNCVRGMIESLGDGEFPIGNGGKAVVRGKMIVTVR